MKKYLLLLLGCFLVMSAYGNDVQKNCLGCKIQREEFALINGFIDSAKILIDSSQHFEARQDCYVPIPGFIVIASKRHVQSIDEFTPEERHDFIEFVYKVRRSMRERLGIQIIDIIQEEDSCHFHVWLFPRYDWMEPFGKDITSIQTIMKWAKKHLNTQQENLEKVLEAAEKLKENTF